MQQLPHLATRIFDTPLLIAPQKLEVILAVLAPRLGLHVPPQAAVVTASNSSQRKSYEVTPDGIAIIPIEGTLVHKSYGLDALSGLRSYTDIQTAIEDAASDPGIKAILLDIDSPGGELAGAFDAADSVYAARAAKPLVAVANNDAFSAAYLLASGADRIYVSRTSGIGSVGVIVTHLDVSGNDEKMGYKYTIIYAGSHKADLQPHAPLSDEARAVLEAEVARTYQLPTAYYRLFRLITKGVPTSSGVPMLNATVHPSCYPMNVPSIQRQADQEGLDYFQVSISFTEIGDD